MTPLFSPLQEKMLMICSNIDAEPKQEVDSGI